MTSQTKLQTIAMVGETDKHIETCRRFSRILFGMCVGLSFLLQSMTFFVALNGGFDSMRALIFALVPLLGPLFCAFQLVFAGAGTPLILFLLFVPCVLTFLGTARFRDECTRKPMSVNNEVWDADIVESLSSHQFAAINPTPLRNAPVTPPAPAPLPKAPATPPSPVRLPESPATPPMAAPLPKAAQTPAAETVWTEELVAAPRKPKTGDEEYDRAVQDVLSILNKRN